MRRVAPVLACGTAIAWALVACGYARVPTPPYARQTTSALTPVPYPPPPARVELVPPPPHDGAVWLDGEWTWQGRRWAWRQGRWVDPPRDGAFAPWTSVRDGAGTLYVAAGTWRARGGAPLPDPPPIVPARTSTGPVVTPEGEPLGPTPIVPADAAPPQVEELDAGEREDGGA